MVKKVIAVDLDDVIADSTEALRIEVNQLVGANLTKEHYSIAGEYWDYYEHVWTLAGIADKVSFKALQTNMARSQSHVTPLHGAVDTLKYLSNNHTIVIVTSRDPAWEMATLKWLNNNFTDLFREVIFVKRGDDTRTKGIVCQEINADLLIDDNVEHCQSALDVGVNVILFGQYGWQLNIPPSLIRCRDWQSVRDYFDAKS